MTDTNRPIDVSAADENYVLCAHEDLDLNCAHGTYCENEWNEENPAQVGRIIGYFSNAGEAVDEYLAGLEKRPEILSFGERHPARWQGTSYYKTAAQHFAADIMPVLGEYGYNDSVLEYLPFSYSRVESEIGRYLDGAPIDPAELPVLWLVSNLTEKGFRDILSTSHMMRAMGRPFNVFGGHLDEAAWFSFVGRSMAGVLTGGDQMQAMIDIADRTTQQAVEIVSQGRRVVTYGGNLHINDGILDDPSMSGAMLALGRDPGDAQNLLISRQIENYHGFGPSMQGTVSLINPEYRDDLKCSEADYMRLICCGDSKNVVLIEKRSGPQHAAIVFPPAPQ